MRTSSENIILEPSGRWQRILGALARRERRMTVAVTPVAESTRTRVAPAFEIAPNDPLLAYFHGDPRVAEIEKLNLESPALNEMRAAGVKVAVPLVSQGELVGLISLGPRLSEQDYSTDDRRLLDNLAGQAAPALRVAQLVRQQQAEIEERERIEQQLRLARVIQQTLLPKRVPELPGWAISAYYQPAWEVGGDFYDFIPFPEGKLGLVIGDVTGKGVPSALVMATTRSILRAASERLISPGQVLQRVNDALCDEIPQNMFVTCLYVLLDPANGTLLYANAGHDLPYHHAGDDIIELRATGMPLGLMPGMRYEEKETKLAPGDSVLFYSDGLAEAHNPENEMLGFPRVKEYIRTLPKHLSLIDFLLDRLSAFTGESWVQEDDVTLVSLQRAAVETAPKRPGAGQGASHDWELLAEFCVPSEPGNERDAIDATLEAVRELRIAPERRQRLETAVGEAVMNAMEHGNKYQRESPAVVEVRSNGSAISVRVIDQGGDAPVGPAEAPNLEAKLEGLQSPRGWGLFLMQRMVDEVNLSSDGSHHVTELILSLDQMTGGEDDDANTSV